MLIRCLRTEMSRNAIGMETSIDSVSIRVDQTW